MYRHIFLSLHFDIENIFLENRMFNPILKQCNSHGYEVNITKKEMFSYIPMQYEWILCASLKCKYLIYFVPKLTLNAICINFPNLLR